MTTDIRAHIRHRLSISLATSVYCRDCDLYLDHLHTVAVETDQTGVTLVVMQPAEIGDLT